MENNFVKLEHRQQVDCKNRNLNENGHEYLTALFKVLRSY